MDISPFNVRYRLSDKDLTAEIRPCCGENNVVDYAVWIEEKLAFTITKDTAHPARWVVALKNADDAIPDELVQAIGRQINNIKHNN